MSKHSHWATIKHKKALQDAQRGKRFTGLLRAIRVAAQKGGGDPEANPTLRAAIEKSKEFNMPRDTIERAIKRGTGELGGSRLEETTFEGYGPEGVAIVVEALTDNRNRTTAEIRKIFDRHGGSLGEQGSAAYIFKDPEKPLFEVKIEDRDAAEKVLKLVNALDDHDDVQSVLANFDIPDDYLRN